MSNNFIKKPITDKLRECKLEECKIMFEPSREDQKFCCRQHSEKDWRLKHPPKTQYKRSPLTATEICMARDRRRDTPERWIKYMQDNPFYFEELSGGLTMQQCAERIFGVIF